MAITLRSTKGAPLTTLELDGNFSDLNTRVTDIEDNGGGGGGVNFTTGTGLALSVTDVLSHADTSNQLSVTGTGRTVIQDISVDAFGHVTFLDSIDLDSSFIRLDSNNTVSADITMSSNTLTASSVITDNLTVNTSANVTGTITATNFTSSGVGTPTINSSTNIVLDATNAVVINSSPIRLNSYTTVEANVVAGVAGDMIYVSDGNSGSPCVAISDGSNWKVISLGANISS